MNKINTPWGKIIPEVSLIPIYYLLFIYCFVYILPYGKFFIGISWFDWLKSEDGPLEWMQFIEYALSSLLAFLIFLRPKKKNINSFIWLLIAFLSFLIAGEEISWGERIFGFSIESITELSIQDETNIHNLPFFHNFILDPALQIICIFLGWIGWRKWPYLTSLPSRKFSLFFLSVSLYFFYYEISWFSTVAHIRNDQEIFEFLLSSGLFLHCWESFKNLFITEYNR